MIYSLSSEKLTRVEVEDPTSSEGSPLSPASSSSSILPIKGRSEQPESPNAVRHKRNAFLVANREILLPLLPDRNYVQKIVSSIGKNEETVPYEQIQAQPRGYVKTFVNCIDSCHIYDCQIRRVRAELRPHQMDGLSYLVYLRRSSAGGILGDEMGLGKTLQILSLFQYVKENEQTCRAPFLVVCPLTVLRSWGYEARKWTDLNVVEYYGSAEQRNRVKRIMKGINTDPPRFSFMDFSDCYSLARHKSSRSIDVLITTYDTLNSDIK